MSSERKRRIIADEQIGDNLETENAPFSFSLTGGGDEFRAAVHAFIRNLVDKVIQLLDLLDQSEKCSK
jgi:hypothetical protein